MIIDSKIPGESNSEFAYQMLRKNIMHLELMPGQIIAENELKDWLHISRTPIREALFRLREEHLIDVYPQNRTCISYIDYNLVQQGMLMRGAVEAAVLRVLCERGIQPQDEEKLKENLQLQYYCSNDDTLRMKFFDLDNEFHQMLFSVANHEWSWKMLQKSSTHHDRIRYLHLHDINDKANVEALYLAHKNIFNLILERNGDAVAEAARIHVQFRPSALWEKSCTELSEYIINLPPSLK